jgi:hypothetical protein
VVAGVATLKGLRGRSSSWITPRAPAARLGAYVHQRGPPSRGRGARLQARDCCCSSSIITSLTHHPAPASAIPTSSGLPPRDLALSLPAVPRDVMAARPGCPPVTYPLTPGGVARCDGCHALSLPAVSRDVMASRPGCPPVTVPYPLTPGRAARCDRPSLVRAAPYGLLYAPCRVRTAPSRSRPRRVA